ncbi:Puromycin N-acetyltransferase-like protein [Hapsidospora chrysogenum ATCC 11550]|uniref:Puromycin N-acetyltransferase-like protein n=1 Tax=Hapsidospora chrysogenum (strain ATCC 11550 / CBS 779.69 / DSM 880 / IAM 14645 / JCM 23072 / IMI 49137) TaxID=857340 RepID=A0A086T8N6_HAPC1|nr:Puromycin N-acetyltransferase-like protein [Hapsidospora chrysogenum ATCC 11550]
MAPKITFRKATEADLPELLQVFTSAFQDSLLNPHCYPASDPETPKHHLAAIKRYLPEIVVAQDGDGGQILGWVRWVRKPVPSPPVTLTNDMYPSSGNQDLARRFFQANVDATARIVKDRPHWFLSLIVVRREAQRRGVGAAMMRYGLDKADEEGWLAYCNGSAEGKPLYESLGFRVMEKSEFEHGIATWHMLREYILGKT